LALPCLCCVFFSPISGFAGRFLYIYCCIVSSHNMPYVVVEVS
jgi:hypothetical protein